MILPILMAVGMHLLLPTALLLSLWRGLVQSRTGGLSNYWRSRCFSSGFSFPAAGIEWATPCAGFGRSCFPGGIFPVEKIAQPSRQAIVQQKTKMVHRHLRIPHLDFRTCNLGVLTCHWPADEALEPSFPLRAGFIT